MTDLISLRNRLNAILIEDAPRRGRPANPDITNDNHSDRLAKSKFSSSFVGLPFGDVIRLHNAASDFDDFVDALQAKAKRFLEIDEANKWTDRVRQAIAKWQARSGDVDRMLKVLGVGMPEIEQFMKQALRPEGHRAFARARGT